MRAALEHNEAMFTTLEDCDGDVEHWYNITLDEFDALLCECRQSRNIPKLRTALKEFQEPFQHGVRLGLDDARVWYMVARAATATKAPPAKRLEYWTRTYE